MRDKRAFVVLVVVGALLGFLAASRPWAQVLIPDPIAERTLRVSGREAAGVVPAVALVALAGAVAVLTTRRIGQAVAGTLLVLAGAAAAASAIAVLRTPTSAVDQVVTAATGRTGVAGVTAVVTAWPWVGVASGVLIAIGGCLAVLRSRSWGGLSTRYDTPARESAVPESTVREDEPGQVWDALSRGEDPTH